MEAQRPIYVVFSAPCLHVIGELGPMMKWNLRMKNSLDERDLKDMVLLNLGR